MAFAVRRINAVAGRLARQCPWLAFPVAIMLFGDQRVFNHGQVQRFIENARRIPRALQMAVNNHGRLDLQRIDDELRGVCLFYAFVGQGYIDMAAGKLGDVGGAFAVADHVEGNGGNHLFFVSFMGYTYSMEQWRDQGFVLGVRPHGEGGAVVSLLTRHNGRHAGYMYGAQSAKKRAMIEPGSFVSIDWKSRIADNLGTVSLEQEAGLPAGILDDPLRLGALLSACALCDAALPEREGHEGLFNGFQTLIHILGDEDIWGAAYIYWEIALLKELGFGLDLTKCAGGGDSQTLAYVSPKSGRAVSYAAAEPYKDKLLELPSFLKPNGGPLDSEEILKGLLMTGHFLEHWVFAHHTKGVPDPRLRFEARYAKYVADLKGTDGQEDDHQKRRI